MNSKALVLTLRNDAKSSMCRGFKPKIYCKCTVKHNRLIEHMMNYDDLNKAKMQKSL